MEFRFTKEQEEFRQEVRQFIRQESPPEWKCYLFPESEDEWSILRSFTRKLSSRGWLNMTWPKEYGGLNLGAMEEAIFTEEMAYHRAPVIFEIGPWVGELVIIHGTEEQKRKYLPPIARGDILLCLGYSEPSAGSDLAAAQTSAIEDNGIYIINGQKIFTTLAHKADYCWLVARTAPELPKHKGLSMFMIDMKTPGVQVMPLIDMKGSHYFNQVFLDDVRVPADCLIGGKNRGWEVLRTGLDIERVGAGGIRATANFKRTLDDLIAFVPNMDRGRRGMTSLLSARRKLAERAIELEIGRLLSYRLAWLSTKRSVTDYEASICRVFVCEAFQRLAQTAMELFGTEGLLLSGSEWAPFNGRLAEDYLFSVSGTIGAGTSEIMRNIIAVNGLHLPRG